MKRPHHPLDDLSKSTSQFLSDSPPGKRMVFGEGPNLTEGGAQPFDLTKFLSQLDTLDTYTNQIVNETENCALKAALQQLTIISQAAGYLLKQELSIKQYLQEERQAHSIVITGLPESTSPKATQRAKEDMEKVLDIMDAVGVECLPTATYRMGGPAANPGRPRLMKVELPTKRLAGEFLRNRGKLFAIRDYKSIFIRPSLSLEQRELRKKLVTERNMKNNALIGDEIDNPYILWGPPGKEALKRKNDIRR